MKTAEQQPNWTLIGVVALTAIVAMTAIYFGARFESPYFTTAPMRDRVGQLPPPS